MEKNSNYVHMAKNVEGHIGLEIKENNWKKWKTNML